MSKTFGPEGDICATKQKDWNITVECHDSCPFCDEYDSCDWQSCYDDVGFIEKLIEIVSETWCINLDHMHMSGLSNGGMFSYFVANHAKDALGLATINPVAASPHVGFGNPPNDFPKKFSILDIHGEMDYTIPYNLSSPYCVAPSPTGGVVSYDGFYFEQKPVLIEEWSKAMNCESEMAYPTPYDGEENFHCSQRICLENRNFVTCSGNFGHRHPLSDSGAAKVAWEFMKNHPKGNVGHVNKFSLSILCFSFLVKFVLK